MKITDAYLNQKVCCGHNETKYEIVSLDSRTKHATVENKSGQCYSVNIEKLREMPKTYEEIINSNAPAHPGCYDVGMLGTVLDILEEGQIVYGRHDNLGEIKVQMNQQRNRITVTPLSVNPNLFPENEIFYHMLNNCWEWYLIKQNEEM